MPKNLKALSKFLAVVLRHKPDEFGIMLDEKGFASLDDVWTVIIQRYGNLYDEVDLAQVVNGDQQGKKRYEIVGKTIRAMYGHSQPRVIYEAVIPPILLFHGTNPKAYETIREDGLLAKRRQYVHLTTNRNNALTVARRKTSHPILLQIKARDAHHAGIVFHRPEAEHYLAKRIPAMFIEKS